MRPSLSILVLLLACQAGNRPHRNDTSTQTTPVIPQIADVKILPTHARQGDPLVCSWTWLGEGSDQSTAQWSVGETVLSRQVLLHTTTLPVGSKPICTVTPYNGRMHGTALSASASLPGNLLVFVADDLGIDKIGLYGAHPQTPNTPTIDDLASTGLRFTRAWAQPVCSPARASLQTGLHPHHTGVGRALGPVNSNPLDPQLLALPRRLKEGTGGLYSSALVGKWHLSGQQLEEGYYTHPQDVGYDRFRGMIHGPRSRYGLRWAGPDLGLLGSARSMAYPAEVRPTSPDPTPMTPST